MAKGKRWRPHSQKQQDALLSKKKITACTTGIQWGKGLPLSEVVLTPTGYVAAGMVEVGDILYSRTGKPTKVIGVFPQGKQPIYEIHMRDGRSIRTDGSHLNIIKPRSGRPERIISTQQLYESSHLWGKAQIPSCSPLDFPARKYEIPPYIMGIILGDGCVRSGIMISTADADILDRVRNELPDDYEIHRVSAYDYKIVCKQRQHNEMGHGYSRWISYLKKIGVFRKKSFSKSIPKDYKLGSIEQRLDLLRGLMDSDGYIEKNKRMEFNSSSATLCRDVIWIVESLGGKAWFRPKSKIPKYRHNGEEKTGKEAFRVNIILKRFNPFYLPRKASKYFQHENTENKVIDRVEYIGNAESVCFKVDCPTESFIINNQVVTHNTTVGAYFLKMLMHKYTAQDDAFIITAPNYKILNQSSLPAWKNVMKGLGEYKKQDALFEMYNGGTCYMRTGHEPDSVVGITNVRGIWADEAGKYSLYFWDNIQGRASFKDCPIIITTSPYSMNWVYKDIVRPTLKGQRDDVLLIQAASNENPYFPNAEFERRKKLMDPRRFQMMYGGKFDQMEGLVYDCFSTDEHVCEPFELPEGTIIVGGIDWGFTNPFVIKIRAITPDGNHWGIAELYKTGMTPTAKKEAALRMIKIWGVQVFYADPEEAGTIAEFNMAGIPTVAADNDIRRGIDAHYELIRSGRYKLFRDMNRYTIDEYEIYHYPEPQDLKPDQDEKDQKPVAQNNHAMDAERYITLMTKHLTGGKMRPKMPEDTGKVARHQENYEQRLKRIKSGGDHKKYEEFS